MTWTPRPKRSGIVHGTANCEDCGWYNGNYKNALATAAKHSDKYGHTVHVEIGTVVTYRPKDGPA